MMHGPGLLKFISDTISGRYKGGFKMNRFGEFGEVRINIIEIKGFGQLGNEVEVTK